MLQFTLRCLLNLMFTSTKGLGDIIHPHASSREAQQQKIPFTQSISIVLSAYSKVIFKTCPLQCRSTEGI